MTDKTTICKWKDNKQAAFSLCADDSSHFHLDFMIPEMDKYGFKGTFWCNPGRETWTTRRMEWVAAAKNGHDLANHTMNHIGADTYEESEYEIGEAARLIRQAAPHQTLLLFLRGGATTWALSREECSKIAEKYECVHTRGTGGQRLQEYHNCDDGTFRSVSPEQMATYPDIALSEGSWRMCAFHDVGPYAVHLCTDAPAFKALLEALDAKKDVLWIDTNTNVQKYVTARDAACITIEAASDELIKLNLTAGLDTWLYNHPLTLNTQVPGHWTRATVTQCGRRQAVKAANGVIQYEALPDCGPIFIRP